MPRYAARLSIYRSLGPSKSAHFICDRVNQICHKVQFLEHLVTNKLIKRILLDYHTDNCSTDSFFVNHSYHLFLSLFTYFSFSLGPLLAFFQFVHIYSGCLLEKINAQKQKSIISVWNFRMTSYHHVHLSYWPYFCCCYHYILVIVSFSFLQVFE